MRKRHNASILSRLRVQGLLAACLLLILLMVSAAPAMGARILAFVSTVTDPLGDAFGVSPQHDVVEYSLSSGSGLLVLTVVFAGPIEPPGGANGVVGYLDLDVDQDEGTGAPPHAATYPQCTAPKMGMDYYVDLSTYMG